MKWQRTNIHLAGLLIAGLLVVAIAVTASSNLRDYEKAIDEAANSQRSLTVTEGLISDLKDAVIAERGYLLTRDARYFAAYSASLPRIRADISKLSDAPGAEDVPATVGELKMRVTSMLDRLDAAMRDAQRGDRAGAIAADRVNARQATMDAVRGLADQLMQSEQARLKVRTAVTYSRRDAMWTMLIGGSAAIILFLIAFALFLNRLMRARDDLFDEAERAREAAQGERDRLKTTLQSIGDAVIVTDAAGRVTLMNPVAERLTAWDGAESEGADIGTVFPIFNSETGAAVANPVSRVLREGLIVGLANHTVLRNRAGRTFPIDDSGAPIRDRSGAMSGVILVFRDVTERYQSQRELEAAEKRYRLLFENNPQPMWVYDTETLGFLAVNDAAVAQYGYSQEEFAGLTLKDIRPPEDVPAMLADIGLSYRLHRDGPWRHRRRDGTVFFVDIIVHPLKFMVRNARMVIATDVTDRVKAESAFRDASDRLSTIVNTAPLAIWTLDPAGRITSWNRTAADILEWSADEAIGRQLPVIAGGDVRESDGEFAAALETTCRRKDGRLLPVTLWSAPLSDHDGQHIGTLVIIADISKRKRDEETMAQTEAGFRLLFENNPQPMWVFDGEQYRFLEVNQAAVSHYGFSREEFLNMYAWEVRSPEDTTPFHPVVNPGAPQNMGLRKHRRKNGTIIEVEIVAHRLEFNGVPAILSVLSDVTEKRILEEQLRQSQKLEAIGRLAGGVAHDFNNMLTVIIGYADMLRAEVPLGSRERGAVNEIGLAAERASSLTRQLLAFSRRQVLKPEALNLNQSILKIQPMLSRLIGENINIVTDLKDELWSVSADPGQVDQIIVNLAVNARDAMKRGGKLTFQTSNVNFNEENSAGHFGVLPGEYVRMVVSDTGHGMDAETRAHIFEPFFTTKEAGRGTGLGLATVYGIVKQSGGDIWVYSEVGLGTSMNVYLPRLAAAEPEKIEKVPAQAAEQGTESVLLVEDEESLRKLITQILEMAGYRVCAAGNADEALRLCADPGIEIDLLITDLVLSKGTGWEIASRAIQSRPGLKTLFMSGYSEGAVFGGSLEAGVNFIQKPFTGADLRSRIREIIGTSPP